MWERIARFPTIYHLLPLVCPLSPPVRGCVPPEVPKGISAAPGVTSGTKPTRWGVAPAGGPPRALGKGCLDAVELREEVDAVAASPRFGVDAEESPGSRGQGAR